MKKIISILLVLSLLMFPVGQAMAATEAMTKPFVDFKDLKYQIKTTDTETIETGSYVMNGIKYEYNNVINHDNGTSKIEIIDEKGEKNLIEINHNKGKGYLNGELVYKSSGQLIEENQLMNYDDWTVTGDTRTDPWHGDVITIIATAVYASVFPGPLISGFWSVAISLAQAWYNFAYGVRDMFYEKHTLREYYPPDEPLGTVFRDTITIKYYYDPGHSVPEPKMNEQFTYIPIFDR